MNWGTVQLLCEFDYHDQSGDSLQAKMGSTNSIVLPCLQNNTVFCKVAEHAPDSNINAVMFGLDTSCAKYIVTACHVHKSPTHTVSAQMYFHQMRYAYRIKMNKEQ